MMSGAAPALARIAVGVDFGEPSRAAAAWVVRDLAPDAEILLVHALHVAVPGPFEPSRPAPSEDVTREARDFVTKRLGEFARELGRPEARLEVRAGGAAPTIGAVAEEWGADVIVVGPHGGDHVPGSGLGSTAERLVRTSPIPVLLAHGMRAGPTRKIVAPVDDVDLTPAVLDWAEMLAERSGAVVTLAHVLDRRWHDLHAPAHLVGKVGAEGIVDDEMLTRATTAADEWLAGLARQLPATVRVERTVASGAPGDEVLATVRRAEADLVVMGRRGRGRVLPGVLGSTASMVLRGAECPVLVVVDPADRVVDDWGTEWAGAAAEG